MAKERVKRCSKSLIIREMQMKTAMRYCLTQVIMPIIKQSTNNKSWRRCGGKGTLLHYWWECKLVQQVWRAFTYLMFILNPVQFQEFTIISVSQFLLEQFNMQKLGEKNQKTKNKIHFLPLYKKNNEIQYKKMNIRSPVSES